MDFELLIGFFFQFFTEVYKDYGVVTVVFLRLEGFGSVHLKAKLISRYVFINFVRYYY